jgi:hypothetical protein
MVADFHWKRLLRRGLPWYWKVCIRALRHGWALKENVFGAVCFYTRDCLLELKRRGFLDLPFTTSHELTAEDCYFTMATVASGFRRDHFAAPMAPLALAWRAMPWPAEELHRLGYKAVHSVDKGRNTTREENHGLTPREFFRRQRVLVQQHAAGG